MAKDFTNKQFPKSLRGYSTDDVDNYLQYVNTEFVKLERHCNESDRKLLFALRKLESLTKEMQKIYEIADINGESSVVQDPETAAPEKTAPARSMTDDELAAARAEIENAKKEAASIRNEAELKASELISAANTRADKIVADAQLQAEAVIASSGKRARAAAEQIITDAALAGRKIIRDAEDKADNACRDVLSIHQAAGAMYNEIVSFRNSLFSLYSGHIESVETISGNAEGLVESIDRIIRELEGSDDGKPSEPQKTSEEARENVPEQSSGESGADEPGVSEEEEPAEEPSPVGAPEENGDDEDFFPESPVETVPEAPAAADDSAEAAAGTDGSHEDVLPEPEDTVAPADALPEDPDQISFGENEVTLDEELENGEPEEYYDSFDFIPDEDEDIREENTDAAEENKDLPADGGSDGTENDDSLPWDDTDTHEDAAGVTPAESGEGAETLHGSAEGPDGNAPLDPFTIDELRELFDIPAEKPADPEPVQPEPVTPAPAQEEDPGDDFELPDDVGSGTSVLDIVKKLGDAQPQKPRSDDFDDMAELLSIGSVVSDDEFNKVFSDSGSAIDDIMRQPVIPPDEPTNPKKHSHF